MRTEASLRPATACAAIVLLAGCAGGPPTAVTAAPSIPSVPSTPTVVTSVIEGSPAPEFTLANALRPGETSLRDLRGKPTVLIFGSCTCPPFVQSFRELNAIHHDYKDRVNFLLVYIREAHPTDGDALPDNRFKAASPRTLDERKELARRLDRVARIEMPIVVDGMDDRMLELYKPWPNRVIILDPRGVAVDAVPAAPRATANAPLRLRSYLDQVLRNG